MKGIDNRREAYLNTNFDIIRQDAVKLRYHQMPSITDQIYGIYDRTGSRVEFENVYFLRRKYLAVYGIMAILYGKREDIDKLEQVITEICKERCWALPAHVDLTKSGWEHTVELYASETAQALTEIAYELGEKLSLEVRELIVQNVDCRVLQPYYESESPYAWWENSEMNWNAVCVGSIGCITIYRYQNDPQYLKQCLLRVNYAIMHYISGYQKDGVCMEGLDYWTYGMSYYCMYAELLSSVTDGEKDLMDVPFMDSILTFQQKCYFCDGITLAFSDGSTTSRFRMGLGSYIASLDNNVQLPAGLPLYFDDDDCYHWAELYRDVIWTKKYGIKDSDRNTEQLHINKNTAKASDKNTELDDETHDMELYIFSESQWVIAKGRQSVYAAKGGCNDEPHNHNDVGNFLFLYRNAEYIADLGAGEYCKDYFNENRYTIFCNAAESHNVPIMNGGLQREGKEYRCTAFEVQDQRQSEQKSERQPGQESEQCCKTTMEITQAYETSVVKQILRNIQYQADVSQLTVTDEFKLSENTTSIEENLVTRCQCEFKDGAVILTQRQGKGQCIITFHTKVSNVRFIQKQHKNHYGDIEQIQIIRWEVPIENHEKAVSTFTIHGGSV